MRNLPAYTVMLSLVVAILTNGIGISFKAEVFTHELDHIHQTLPQSPQIHLEAHRDSSFMDVAELDAATHLCLHAAGQYQPFYFIHIPLVPPGEGNETRTIHIPLTLPDSVLESPYHPPRTA